MYILARRHGALLHAAGIDINGKGYIFPGKSGAGKSTITRQFAALGDTGLLSDDRIVVRKIEGGFKAYGTPWPGEAGIALNKSVPLAGIFFINHGSANRIREITPKEALARLLPVTSIPWYDREVMDRILTFCEDLISSVPIYELDFKPSVEVVDVFERFVSAQT
jgi:serine kinase of HPr protein (carbohydrate metabolism regulator)